MLLQHFLLTHLTLVKIMKLEEFENQYRNAMDDTLNQLQTVILLLAQVESQVRKISSSVQSLSLTVEKYINENKSE
ncbi:hypothetical protein [Coleofasciculus sp. FACHB-501]|uniref:hypothetical protein n=1 Tax=Coleofasciculus sp. FACHB-501 TaxID=2692786 RepID=UPI001F548DCA|nr:hypothetical protein [Coleofasciculus sp. FACHB-501]